MNLATDLLKDALGTRECRTALVVTNDFGLGLPSGNGPGVRCQGHTGQSVSPVQPARGRGTPPHSSASQDTTGAVTPAGQPVARPDHGSGQAVEPTHSLAIKNPRLRGGPGIQYYEEHRIGKYAPATHHTTEHQAATSRNCTSPGQQPANAIHGPVASRRWPRNLAGSALDRSITSNRPESEALCFASQADFGVLRPTAPAGIGGAGRIRESGSFRRFCGLWIWFRCQASA